MDHIQPPSARVRLLNRAATETNGPRASARYVLYWAQANRRLDSNPALAFAVELANRGNLPVLVYEGLTDSHPFANDRLHRFILEGVPENERRAAALGMGYVFHLRRKRSDPNDAFYKSAADAAAVVTDDYPSYIVPEHNRRVSAKLDVPYYAVDASCIVPMGVLTKQEYAARTIRPKIQKVLSEYLQPLDPVRVKRKWRESAKSPLHTRVTPENIAELLAASEIDHAVPPSADFRGGRTEGLRRLRFFLEKNLVRYAKLNREPAARATSRLSPYLHFGYVSALEAALAVRDHAEEHKWMATEFLEQLIVRRELAFNFARYGRPPDSLDALPEWARKTLAKHAGDARNPVYKRDQFERAETHDALWNATQRELLRDGFIHGYYRMYWGKKIVEWSPTPQEALETMIYLHDRYALDGRDPNTYTNILWCLGLHDRPWGERTVFGTVRYMSLEGMKRKTDVEAYIREQSV